jgi:Ca-activated chloride channel homolog
MVGKTVCFVVKMKFVVATYLFYLIGVCAYSQHQNQLYHGNQSYLDGDFDQAQMYYQQALSGDPNIYEGNLNLGNTNFRKQDFEGAISLYQKAAENSIDDSRKAKALHNLGNTYLQNQKIDEAIDAYKDALRANPKADETRYNLAYAQNLKQQQQEQQQDQNQDQENQDQNKDQKDQEKNEDNQDKKDQNKDNKEQEKEQKENKDQQDQKDKSDQEKEQEQKAQPKPIELSPREAEQMLEAAKNEDQKLQMQLRKQQVKTKNIDKDW